MIRTLIEEDHTVIRKGLKQIWAEAFLSSSTEVVADTEELMKKIIKAEWDIIISDLSMPGRSGLEALQQIKEHYPKLPVLILSMHSEEHYAIRVLKAGTSGYLNKDSAPGELVNAVNRLLSGRKYITSSIAEKLADTLDQDYNRPSHDLLSDSEFEVLKRLASGKSVSEIALSLSLGATTVSTYRARILAKMNMKTNADLTLYAVENKLL